MASIDEQNQVLLDRYLELVLEVNKSINLTRIDSIEQARILHIEDSLSALPEFLDAPEGLYGDLGSGGGFPGIPLAIVSCRQTVLVDSVQKKMKALEGIISELGLSNRVTTYAGRIEDLALERKGSFSVLTARALSRLDSLLELASPLLTKHGQLICFKARTADEELEAALSMQQLVGMELVSRRSFMLSDGDTFREILVFEKTGKPRLKLPRRVGLAQKKPLQPR